MTNGQYRHELDVLSQSRLLFEGSRDEVLAEFGSKLTICMQVERINVWLFEEARECILCIGQFAHSNRLFSKGQRLRMAVCPHYFELLRSNKVIAVADVMTAPETAELANIYCLPSGIVSMLDIPVRLEGRLVGVMCFEHCGEVRTWEEEEINFALAVSQILALAVETAERRKAQVKLQKVLKEKDLLLKEMHHRIKNNLSVLVSMLRLSESEVDDTKAALFLKETENRLFTIAEIHEQLYKGGQYLNVELKAYLTKLTTNLLHSQSGKIKPQLKLDLDATEVPTSVAVNIGLIVTEALNNIFKHAFRNPTDDDVVSISLHNSAEEATLTVLDNGGGFETELASDSAFGLGIIRDLTSQIGGKSVIRSSTGGTELSLSFLLK